LVQQDSENERLAFDPELRTESSVDDDEQPNVCVQIQDEPQIPIILVSAQSNPITKDAQVGTVSNRTESGHSNRESRVRSTSSELYDQDEPLTTKVVKVYKKSTF